MVNDYRALVKANFFCNTSRNSLIKKGKIGYDGNVPPNYDRMVTETAL